MGVLSDAWALFRRDADLLVRVAGAFLFLPQLTLLLIVPAMPTIELTPDMTEAQQRALAQVLTNWVAANGGWVLLAMAMVHFGSLVVLSLYLRRDRPDLKAALAGALRQFPRFLVAMMIVVIPLGLGEFVILLLIPALYLQGRLMLAGPVLADRRGGIRAAIGRSWRLTKGNGLILSGLVSLTVIGSLLLGAPFLMIDKALRANAPNPLAIAMADVGAAAALAACMVGAVLIQVAVYRRLNDGI